MLWVEVHVLLPNAPRLPLAVVAVVHVIENGDDDEVDYIQLFAPLVASHGFCERVELEAFELLARAHASGYVHLSKHPSPVTPHVALHHQVHVCEADVENAGVEVLPCHGVR